MLPKLTFLPPGVASAVVNKAIALKIPALPV